MVETAKAMRARAEVESRSCKAMAEYRETEDGGCWDRLIGKEY